MDVITNVAWLSEKQKLAQDPTLLSKMMNFDHPALKERMVVKFGWSKEFADKLFEEMKKFLFLCATNEGAMAPPEDIDEIWHNFILFTGDYAEYCNNRAGMFLHHQPLTMAQHAQSDGSMIERTLRAARTAFGEKLSEHWSFAKVPGSCGFGKCGASTNCQS